MKRRHLLCKVGLHKLQYYIDNVSLRHMKHIDLFVRRQCTRDNCLFTQEWWQKTGDRPAGWLTIYKR